MTKAFYGKNVIIVAAITVIMVIGYSVLHAPDRRSDGQKISDTLDALPNGMEKAVRQLDDRTPADKPAKDAGDDIKKATNQP